MKEEIIEQIKKLMEAARSRPLFFLPKSVAEADNLAAYSIFDIVSRTIIEDVYNSLAPLCTTPEAAAELRRLYGKYRKLTTRWEEEQEQVIDLIKQWVDAGSFNLTEEEFTADKLKRMERIEQQIAARGYNTVRQPCDCIGGDVYELKVYLHGQLIGMAKTTNIPDYYGGGDDK